MKTIATHVFVWDGAQWPDRIRRCGRPDCGHPEGNRVHRVPDVTEQQDEHKRRVGESGG